MVERDRFEEHRHRAVGDRRRHAGAQHRRRVGGVAGAGDHEPGDVAQHADRVVVVEVAAEALLVGEPGDAHDHRVAVPPLREERQAGGLATQLVLGVVEVGEVLDLGDREQARHGRTEGDPEDRLLVEQAVEHPRRAGALLQAAGHPVDAALGADVLAEHEHVGSRREQVAERAVDRLGEREWPLRLRQPAAEERGTRVGVGAPSRRVRATASARRGDNGAITAAALVSVGPPIIDVACSRTAARVDSTCAHSSVGRPQPGARR